METTIKYANIIFKGLVLLLVIFLLLKNCGGSLDKVVSTVDTLSPIQNALVKEFNKLDSATTKRDIIIKREKDTIVKYEIKYKTKIIEIIKLAPDTCSPYLIALINEAADLDSIKSYHILRQDSSITDYKKQVTILKRITANDTIRITQLSDSLRTERKSKRKFINGFKWGISTGVLLSGAVYVGTILK